MPANISEGRDSRTLPGLINTETGRRRLARRLRRSVLVCVTSGAFAAGSFAMASEPPMIELEPFASGLSDVVYITHAGDERLFLVERGRRFQGSMTGAQILVHDGTKLLATPMLDISDRVSPGAWSEGGLLSIAFDPDFAANRYLYAFYLDSQGDSVVARYQVSAADPNIAELSSETILLEIDQPFSAHLGGQLQFGPDGYLYISTGDGGPGEDPECRAQDLSVLLGKILRIDPHGTPPAGANDLCGVVSAYGIPPQNPFAGGSGDCDEVWAYGLRNPWRFSFDRLTGDMFIGDVGQDLREEVDFEPAGGPGGQNYGWRIMEGTACFDPDIIDQAIPSCSVATSACHDPSFTPPVLEFDNLKPAGECSIIGGYVYRGERIRGLEGAYLFGDWCSPGTLWALRRDGGGIWSRTAISAALPGLVTWGEDRDGELLLSNGTEVYRLAPAALLRDDFESGDLSSWSQGP